MTIDPSAIPNFGGQPQQPPTPQGPPPVIIPDAELVKQLLDQMQLKHGEDAEGDVVAPWEEFQVYFMFRGEQKELFAVRAFYSHAHELAAKTALLEALDEWNRETLWPKVYTQTTDEGQLRVVGETQMIVGMGVNINYFAAMVVNWVQASVTFNQWINERLGLVKAVDDEAAEGGEGGAEGDGDSAES
ncbi:YbjN domain-containing protein [Streptacidiphilus jiangxiensis]|uniref:Putative sensory transduction regulator n=1 Tax=Streptacidiphilus jiangxiensis TaxID=235985 RepID=A0A1H7JS24_STRJI|nr:YbjN domain-containing protein [Streptacidiphilus jiangxiensis]SEK77373.1 Putative sensory transduction regulator [Streptacidiphilus jiangxiensis]